MSSWLTLFYWFAFLSTTVWGHIGFKAAIKHDTPLGALNDLFSIIGFSSLLAWVFSAGFWALILSQQSLIRATTIANIRYPLICLLAAFFFRETASRQQLVGIFVITLGLFIYCPE